MKRGRHPNQESKGPQRREVAFERAEELAEPNKTLILASLNGLDDSFWTMKRKEQVVTFTERLSETSITQEEIGKVMDVGQCSVSRYLKRHEKHPEDMHPLPGRPSPLHPF